MTKTKKKIELQLSRAQINRIGKKTVHPMLAKAKDKGVVAEEITTAINNAAGIEISGLTLGQVLFAARSRFVEDTGRYYLMGNGPYEEKEAYEKKGKPQNRGTMSVEGGDIRVTVTQNGIPVAKGKKASKVTIWLASLTLLLLASGLLWYLQ